MYPEYYIRPVHLLIYRFLNRNAPKTHRPTKLSTIVPHCFFRSVFLVTHQVMNADFDVTNFTDLRVCCQSTSFSFTLSLSITEFDFPGNSKLQWPDNFLLKRNQLLRIDICVVAGKRTRGVRSQKKREIADTVDYAQIYRGIDELFRNSIHQQNLLLHNSSSRDYKYSSIIHKVGYMQTIAKRR